MTQRERQQLRRLCFPPTHCLGWLMLNSLNNMWLSLWHEKKLQIWSSFRHISPEFISETLIVIFSTRFLPNKNKSRVNKCSQMSNYIIVTIVVIVVTCVTIVLKLSARWAHRKKKTSTKCFFLLFLQTYGTISFSLCAVGGNSGAVQRCSLWGVETGHYFLLYCKKGQGHKWESGNCIQDRNHHVANKTSALYKNLTDSMLMLS